MKTHRRTALLAAPLLLAACGAHKTAVASAGCKTVTPKQAASRSHASGAWPYSDGDLANTRDAAGSAISSANVSALKPGGAWETPLVSGDGSVTYGIGNPYQTA